MADFAILSKLGTGSYSDVYRVKRLSDNKEYALKKVFNIVKYNYSGKTKQTQWKREGQFTQWSSNTSFH